MELALASNISKKLFEGDGGSYHFWSNSDLPLLEEAKVGAAKLVLKPLGFTFPHYGDSAKVGYVTEGRGMAGLVLAQDPKEKIVTLEKGDAIEVPLACVSWWYNDGESEFSIVFLGDTSTATTPGEFTYFFLAGTASIFTGFSTEFITKSFGIGGEEAKKLFGSQHGVLIVKLQEKLLGLQTCKADDERGIVIRGADHSLSLLKIGFSASVVKLYSDAMWRPRYSPEPAVQVIFVSKGSARFQIVGSNGNRVLDAEVDEGFLLVVPKFFVASAIPRGQGVEWFSISVSTQPVFGCLAGKEASLLRALSPQILGASLSVNQDLVKLLISEK